MIINDHVKDTLAKRCFGFITSFNSQMRSEMTRVFGYSFDEASEILSVYVYKDGSSKLLACLDNTKKMSAVLNDPMTFQTIRMKGDYISHADSSPEEEALVKGIFRDKKAEVFKMYGLPENFADIWNRIPSLTIKIQCKEIFDQTPKLNTGVKIS